jgi:hypothetical protein
VGFSFFCGYREALNMNASPARGATSPLQEPLTIELADRGRRDALRDYCLRLGAAVECEGATIRAAFSVDDDDDLAPYLLSWAAVNEVHLEIHRGEPVRVSPPAGATMRPEQTVASSPPPRLGELLVKKGLISEQQLADALQETRATGDLLGRVLLRTGCVYEEELARKLAEQWSIPYVSLMRKGVDSSVASLLPREVGLRVAAIPVRRRSDEVQVAFADPSDPAALEAVQRYFQAVSVAVAELSDIEMSWQTLAA